MGNRWLAPVISLIGVGGCVVGEDYDEDNDPVLYFNEADDSRFDDGRDAANVDHDRPLVKSAVVPAWPAYPPDAYGWTLGTAGFEDPTLAKHGLAVAKGSSYSAAKVLYSVPLPDYAGEFLVVRGGFMVSKCGAGDIAGGGDVDGPCDKYMPDVSPYAPIIGARLVLASSPSSTGGTPITGWIEEKCTENKHHCGMSIAALWAGGSGSYINLVAGAKADGKKGWTKDDLVELEADCRTSYAQCPITDQLNPWQHGSKGRLDVTRFGAAHGGDTQPIDWGKGQAAITSMAIPQNKAITTGYLPIFVAPIDVRPGQMIDVDAALFGHVSGGQPQDRSFVGTTVMLAAAPPSLTTPFKFGNPSDAPISSKNGRNCRRDDACPIHKSGTWIVPADAPPTMYVVVLAMAKVVGGSTNKTWSLDAAKLAVYKR